MAASSFAASTNSPAMNTDPATLKKLPLFRIRLTQHVWVKVLNMLFHAFSGISQPEEQISRGRRDVQIIGAIGGRHAAAPRPARGHGQIVVLLQTPT